ncbi:SLAM family member 6 isoform X1 [Calypte anna]|uniref:SLAM family member 6 isoform X1 n=1 Tax=Calypte anna TaxID=9244 RepID=UPI0011C3C184|nr:SLAM family member 6 isoform X1 [Calypte anna]
MGRILFCTPMVLFCSLPLTLLLLHPGTCTKDVTEVPGAVGKSVTFSLPSLNGENTAWSFHNEVIVTVKSGNPPEDTLFDERYKSRLTFPQNGSALTIAQLRMEDSGTYTAKISGVKSLYSFLLHVYRELEEPRVTCKVENCSSNTCIYTLHCTAEASGSGNISYGWSTGNELWGEGPEVLVEASALEKLPVLTCRAQNPISTHNITVTSPAALCTDLLLLQGTNSRGQVGLVAVLVVGAIVILVLGFLAIYYKFKGWRIFPLPAAKAPSTEAGADYSTVYAEVGPSQQLHLQGASRAQQDDPKKMPNLDVEPSKTIYFTVQAVAQTDDEKMSKGLLGCQDQD